MLVAFDISDDKRRARLHNALLDFGTPVQYSLFECLLDSEAEARMRQAVGRIARKRLDNVRFYTLCATCLGKVETIAGNERPGQLPPALVVG